MKNKLFVWCAALGLAAGLLLSGCSSAEYTVAFDGNSDAGVTIPSQTVTSGKTIAAPDDPVREGYTFLGWFQDAGLTQPWDVAAGKVKSDLTLYAGWDKDTGDAVSDPGNDKDFSALRTPGSQEGAYEYTSFFLPEADGVSQPYVGDTMPYYEDGTYYIYYLKFCRPSQCFQAFSEW